MTTNTAKRYPLGIQTFETIIEEDYLYIDKTEYVYNMTRLKYVFLSRPRRFGKSLLTSTIKSYFEGRKDLFQGLALERLEKDWATHPVLHFDMSRAKHVDKQTLQAMLSVQLGEYERIYGKTIEAENLNDRLTMLIKTAHEKTGQKVVVLIDEYDAPLLDVIHEDENLKDLRQVMRNFYSPLKHCDPHLRFVFLTGITKFSQLSIFSELNNIRNISMLNEYAAICGITQEELTTQMKDGIEALAAKLEFTTEEAIQALKANYDGYHFTADSPDIYNPYSLLNALADGKLSSYWFSSGTPTYLIEMLRKFQVSPSALTQPVQAMADDFDSPTERMTDITPLLYQSGYITIKDYDKFSELYLLGIPNREIQIGLLRALLPNYLGPRKTMGNTTAALMSVALLQDRIDDVFLLLQKFLKTIPYVNNVNAAENREGHWQQMLHIIFSLLGAKCDVEVHTQHGRIDLVALTAQKRYLIEVKLDQSAETTMQQIDLADYADRYALSTLPTIKVGANFSLEQRNITDWKVEE